MSGILILVHGNRFLINKIDLLSTKKFFSERKDSDLHLLCEFQNWHLFLGVGVCIWFNIPFTRTFLYFIKLGTENIFRKSPLPKYHPLGLRETLFEVEWKFNLITSGVLKSRERLMSHWVPHSIGLVPHLSKALSNNINVYKYKQLFVFFFYHPKFTDW